MHIAIASDHAGFEYKERLKLFLIESGHIVEDFGTHNEQPVDYPLVIRPCAEAVAGGEFDRGIVLGGSGNGEAIVANRVAGVRCALCWNLKSARLARQHNNANMLSLGQRMIGFDEARAIVECWLETGFERGRHLRRIRQIDRPPPAGEHAGRNGPLPHRLALEEEATCVCESCRQEFVLPVDITDGPQQQHVEECPVCCHENVILIDVDEEGGVRVRGSRDVTA
jgi:ribose 5-phosphate isomerase B